MSQEVPDEPILAALRRLQQLERDEPIEYNSDRLEDCDLVAHYLHGAEWEDEKITQFIARIQNQDVQRKIQERLEVISVESDEDTVSYGTDHEFLTAEEGHESDLVKAKLDHPPLRV